jgi:hypothetical protein
MSALDQGRRPAASTTSQKIIRLTNRARGFCSDRARPTPLVRILFSTSRIRRWLVIRAWSQAPQQRVGLLGWRKLVRHFALPLSRDNRRSQEKSLRPRLGFFLTCTKGRDHSRGRECTKSFLRTLSYDLTPNCRRNGLMVPLAASCSRTFPTNFPLTW